MPFASFSRDFEEFEGLEILLNDYSLSTADMALRRVVVASRPDDTDIEQTTFEANNQRPPNNNESAPTSQDITYQSNDEHVLSKKYSQLSLQCQEGTWLELQSRANAEAIITSSLPIFGPKMFQRQYEKALFYPGDSHWKKLRSIVIFSVVIISVIFYLYLDMEVLVMISMCLTLFTMSPYLVSLYSSTGIRTTDGRPGNALRVFSMLNENERSLLSKKYLSLVIFLVTCGLGIFIFEHVYIFFQWEIVPLWAQIIVVLLLPVLFIPQFALFSLIPLFCYTADTTDRLFAQQKIFVYDQLNGCINWVAVQQNFDICECIIDDVSKGFQWVFVGSILQAVVTTAQVIGIISQFSSWQSAGYQPSSIVYLLMQELLMLFTQILSVVAIWSAGSQITSACDGILDQCSNVLAFLRMSPSFKMSTDEYVRARLFHTYVKEANLGFKVFRVRISYTLATTVLVPLASVLSIVLPIVFKSH